ncbi:hypothetical protein JW979_06865, partial [bacterium]|nr:hypothetical protein [candidate division CSSED10-310 bacterium]
ITPNQIRADIFGKEPDKNSMMDSYYLPINLIPIATEKSVNKSFKPITKAEDETEKRRAKLWRSIIIKAEPLERPFARAMSKLFKEQKAEVLGNWEKANKKKSAFKLDSNITKESVTQAELFDEQVWIEKFNKEALPFITEAIKTGGNHALTDLGVDEVFNIRNPATEQMIHDRLQMFGIKVNGTTTEKIAEQITIGMNNGESISEIAARLSNIFDQAEVYRANVIARTETMNAFNYGNMEGMIQSGLVDEHEWITSRDANVRTEETAPGNSHLALDGVTVKLGEDFPVGFNYGGWTAAWPSDYNERCSTSPVRKQAA